MLEQLYEKYLAHPIVCTDTRNIIPNSIFFALKGPSFDANKFASKALGDGCAYAVIDDPQYQVDERYVLVDDVLQILQDLANFHRKQFTIPFIGITGSNGKTTSKELINSVLSMKYSVLATEGNLNNHIGVPLTLLKVNKEHEIAIIEMGANHQGEIDFLCNIAEPNFGIVTNIGKAHLEGFGGFEGVVKTKTELYRFINKQQGLLFVNNDNNLLVDKSVGCNKHTYGITDTADYIGALQKCDPYVTITINAKEDAKDLTPITTQLIGKYNFENVLAAACIGDFFDVSLDSIKKALETYTPSNNRSQVVQKKGNTILLDAYNANPTSMKVAIDNFAQLTANNKVVVLGDMKELGDESKQEHATIVKQLDANGLTNVYLVGKSFMEVAQIDSHICFDNVDLLAEYICKNPILNSSILVKGSRSMQLEKLLEQAI